MKTSSFVGLLALLFNVGFGNSEKHHSCETKCLTDGETSRLIDGFRKVISESPPNKTLAAEIIAEDFISISDSVNFVDEIPVRHSNSYPLDFLGKANQLTHSSTQP